MDKIESLYKDLMYDEMFSHIMMTYKVYRYILNLTLTCGVSVTVEFENKDFMTMSKHEMKSMVYRKCLEVMISEKGI